MTTRTRWLAVLACGAVLVVSAWAQDAAPDDAAARARADAEGELVKHRLEKVDQWQGAINQQKEALEEERKEYAGGGEQVLAAVKELAAARRALMAVLAKGVEEVQKGDPEQVDAQVELAGAPLVQRVEVLSSKLELTRVLEEAKNLAALSDDPNHKQAYERLRAAVGELFLVQAKIAELQRYERDLHGFVEAAMNVLKTQDPGVVPDAPRAPASQPAK